MELCVGQGFRRLLILLILFFSFFVCSKFNNFLTAICNFVGSRHDSRQWSALKDSSSINCSPYNPRSGVSICLAADLCFSWVGTELRNNSFAS